MGQFKDTIIILSILFIYRIFSQFLSLVDADEESIPLEEGVPPSMAIGIYQELRTLPENLISWKKYIIEPLANAGCEVNLFFSIRLLHSKDADTLRRTVLMPSL
jgi:hypothetical protein